MPELPQPPLRVHGLPKTLRKCWVGWGGLGKGVGVEGQGGMAGLLRLAESPKVDVLFDLIF